MKKVKIAVAMMMLALTVPVSAAMLPVPVGHRAVVVNVLPSEIIHIKPGDRVDMIACLPGAGHRLAAETLLQNALVLETVNKDKVFSLVLALSPVDAQNALLAQAEHRPVNFVIRGKGDSKVEALEMATFGKLMKAG